VLSAEATNTNLT